MVKKFDFLVIGSGLAGMSFALKVAHKGKVALICKAGLEEANTYFAQGGIASAVICTVCNRFIFDGKQSDGIVGGKPGDESVFLWDACGCFRRYR